MAADLYYSCSREHVSLCLGALGSGSCRSLAGSLHTCTIHTCYGDSNIRLLLLLLLPTAHFSTLPSASPVGCYSSHRDLNINIESMQSKCTAHFACTIIYIHFLRQTVHGVLAIESQHKYWVYTVVLLYTIITCILYHHSFPVHRRTINSLGKHPKQLATFGKIFQL